MVNDPPGASVTGLNVIAMLEIFAGHRFDPQSAVVQTYPGSSGVYVGAVQPLGTVRVNMPPLRPTPLESDLYVNVKEVVPEAATWPGLTYIVPGLAVGGAVPAM
jgi:hypothetical protein